MTEAPAFTVSPRDLTTREDLTLPMIVYGLYLLALPTGGLSLIAGLILAYAQQGGAGPAARSHYDFAIRTFWLGLVGFIAGAAVCVIGALLMVVLIGFPILLVGALMLAGAKLWYVVRCILGIAKAAQHEAYPRPDALMV
jgi:uncharacterized membrane protein